MSTEILVKPANNEGNTAYEGDGINNYSSFDATEELELSDLDTASGDVMLSGGDMMDDDLEHDEDDDDDESYEIVNSLRRDLPSRRSKTRGSIRNQSAGYKHLDFVSQDDVEDGETGEGDIEMDIMPKTLSKRRSSKKLDKNIRRMTVSINDKRRLREEATKEGVVLRDKPGRKGKEKKKKTISIWVEYKSSFSMKTRRVWQNLKSSLSSFHLWQGHMKTVQGVFGTGVLSYFTFLRWLLYLNIGISLLVVCFLLIPQVVRRRSYEHNGETFTGLELLTGEGWFTDSELYYGEYSHEKDNAYDMQLAYLCLGCGYILICLGILVVSIGRQYKETYIIGGESFTRFSSKVFCSWDYTISSKDTALLKQQSIYRDILENVGPVKGEEKKPIKDRLKKIGLRFGTWFISLAIIAFSIWLVVYVTDLSVKGMIKTGTKETTITDMLPAIIISVVNIIIPPVLRMIALLEKYSSSETAINVTLFRTILLQLGSVCVYVAFLYIEIRDNIKKIKSKSLCWETFAGQVFYKLVVIDFLATLISTFFNEFIRNLLSKYCRCCKNYKPGFDISKNVLNLIYAQGIVWLGTFFSPLLPLINVFKLIIIFYVKRISVTQNCKPSVKPFRASKMGVLFRALLSLMLIFTCVVIGVVVLDTGFVTPSKECGPFRNDTRIYNVVIQTVDDLPTWLKEAIEIITSWVVMAALIMILILLAHYFRLKKNTTAQKIEGLKYQLTLASQDKQFLIRQIRDLIKTAPTGAAGALASSLVKDKIT